MMDERKDIPNLFWSRSNLSGNQFLQISDSIIFIALDTYFLSQSIIANHFNHFQSIDSFCCFFRITVRFVFILIDRIILNLNKFLVSLGGNMPVLTIRDIPVDFPKDPYPCQIQYMDKVIEALNNNQNALLESPTGTGKTLCLLCATLAWQKARNVTNPNIGKVEIYRSATSNRQISVSGGTNASNSNFSIIIYATRTHSQLAQVVDELRSTNYRPRMSVLGSREQLCIHDKISKLKGSVLNHSCNSLVSRRGCMYKNNSENFIDTSNSKENDILDIEDLTKIGHTKKICPYFFARDYSTSAEIVFMPYNYLLDSSIRKTIKLPWENAIIVFDEAHNLERVASDAASFSINSTDIASCIQELQQVVQLMKDDYELKAKEKALTDKDGSNKSTSSLSAEVNTTAGVQKPTLQSCVYLLKAMFALEKAIDHIQLYPIESGQPPSSTLPGNWLVEAYQEAGFYNELVSYFVICILP